MSFTQTDLDNINAAIATGELTVSVAGRTVTYRSIDELLKARSLILAELAVATSPRRGAYRVTFATHRGH